MDRTGIKGTVMTDVPMKRYTSMKVGGPAKLLVYPSDEGDLAMVLTRLKEEGTRSRFLGNGTNIVVSDAGIDEALIRLTRMRHTRYRKAAGGVVAEVSGGASLTGFIRENARRGLSGLEKLFWIPGTVGGAVKMNAGSFGAAISDTLDTARTMDRDGTMGSFSGGGGDFQYRRSPVKASECVVSARFLLVEKDRQEILRDMEYVYGERRKRHPMECPSAGSVFRAVNGEPAWKFIESAGLKGFKIGGASVSEKHANFIVNRGSATAADIKALIERIKKEVCEKSGVSLQEEVELWGFHA